MFLMITEIFLIATLFIVLFSDLLLSKNKRSLLGILTALGFLLALVAQIFFWNESGSLFEGMYVQDEFSKLAKVLFLIIGFFLSLMIRTYATKLVGGQGEFYLLLIAAIIGMSFGVSSTNLLLIFIGLEIITFSSYIMTSYLKHARASIEAGIKYLIFGAISTAFGLLGMSLIYGGSASLDILTIKNALLSSGSDQTLLIVGFLFIFISLTFKMAIVPFQVWAPDVYEGSPTPVTAFFSIASKTAAITIFLRIFYEIFLPIQNQISIIFAVIIAATLVYANFAAIPQKNIKRLFGFSSMSHAGFILMGFLASDAIGVGFVLFYLFSLIATNLAAFFVLSLLANHSENDRVIEYEGLKEKSPMLATCLFVSLLSLTGIPPTSGFVAKLLVLYSAVNEGFLWLAVIGIFMAILSAYYYLSIVGKMFLEKPKDTSPINIPLSTQISLYLTVGFVVILGVVPGPFIHLCQQAATSLF